MNEHDAANLEFLLTVDKTTLQAWFDSASDDDKAYAEELLYDALNEIDDQTAGVTFH